MSKPLLSKKELIDAGYPYGKAIEGIPLGDPKTEFLRTKPDYIVYQPKNLARGDTGNEHFLVFPNKNQTKLLALWLQSTREGSGDECIVLAESQDGHLWSEPRVLLKTVRGVQRVRWGVPFVTKSGRIYILYRKDTQETATTNMAGIFSDDDGETWSEPGEIPFPKTPWDPEDVLVNWVAFQVPVRDAFGNFILGITVSTSDRYKPYPPTWFWNDTHAMLMRFTNMDEDPACEDIRFTLFPTQGISVPNPVYSGYDSCQEPSVVCLPDGRLFVLMRTLMGSPYYSLISADGNDCTEPQPLRYRDGTPVLHPLSPCPVYALSDGRYVMLNHNNMGKIGEFDQLKLEKRFNTANFIRNPTYVSFGTYSPQSPQGIEFDPPVLFADTEDIAVGPKATAESCTYTSLTCFGGETVLWYPDRKFYLLGKKLL